MDVSWHPYNPTVDEHSLLRQPARKWFHAAALLKQRMKWLYLLLTPVFTLVEYFVFIWNIRLCDAAVFVGGSTIMPAYMDRRIAKALGLRVINVFLGSTSRPHFMSGAVSGTRRIDRKKATKLARRMRRQRDRVRAIASACEDVIENPLCSQYHVKPCIDWFQFGFPSGGETFGERHEEHAINSTEEVRILHCPSRPEIKGTEEIRACIEHLRDKAGLPVCYTEITGMPHSEVLAHLSCCDFVIDELYSDSPMAGFASEAAWFGKPAIVGGYGWDILENLPSASVAPPTHICRPEELEDAVRLLISNRAYRKDLGKRAQRYCEEFLGGAAYVERMEKVLENRVPDDWRFEPKETTYIHGLGQDEARLRMVLKDIEQHIGMTAFCLDDRPDLQDAIRRLIAGGRTTSDGTTA